MMKNLTVEELDEMNRSQILEHLLRLSPEDRRLRFCITTSDDFIRAYAQKIMSIDSDLCFGAFADGKLVGLANIAAIDGKCCELAFSIDSEYRGSGLARNLMKSAIAKCRELGVSKLCMSCLRENKKMQALATSFGLNMTITYDEAYAELGITR